MSWFHPMTKILKQERLRFVESPEKPTDQDVINFNRKAPKTLERRGTPKLDSPRMERWELTY